MGRKVFSSPFEQQNFVEFSDFLFIFMVSFLYTFPKQFELCFYLTSNIQEVIKLYNPGDKSFETDLTFVILVIKYFENQMFQVLKLSSSNLECWNNYN